MSQTSAEKMDIILDELKKTLYIDPVTNSDANPASDIKTWFKRIDKADTDTHAVVQRLDRFYINIRARIPGNYPLSPQELVDGDFATPQELLDRIES